MIKRHTDDLYHALVEPHLHYCAPVWGNGSEKVTKATEIAQRKAVRALIDYSEKSTTKEIMDEQNIQQVRKRWMVQDAAWLFKIRNATVDSSSSVLDRHDRFQNFSAATAKPNQNRMQL